MEDDTLPGSTVIICSRGRPQLLRDCVQSVLNSREIPRELIIVDDSAGADPVLATLDTDGPCEIRYCWRHAKGLSSAMNFAICEAHNDVLVFTQDDAEVAPSWLENAVRSLSESGRGMIVTGQVQAGDAEMPGGFVANANVRTERMIYQGRLDRDVLYAQNMALYRSDAIRIGGFDERLGPGTPFPGSEDSDFAFRALEAGYSIVYDPSIVVRHRAWRPQEQHLRFRFGYGFARGGFYAKYIGFRGDRFMLRRLWSDVRNHLVAVPALVRKDPRRAFGHCALALGVVAGAVRWKVSARRSDGAR
jgi:GT2 family glycosyltransferase